MDEVKSLDLLLTFSKPKMKFIKYIWITIGYLRKFSQVKNEVYNDHNTCRPTTNIRTLISRKTAS